MTRPFLLAALLACAGCSGAGLRGQIYRGDGLYFRIGEVPPTWEPLRTERARIAFRDNQTEATILVNARCHREGDDVPLASLTRQLFMTFTDREVFSEETVPMDGREALHTVLKAKLDGVPKMFDVYVLKKDSCVYDFVVVSAIESFERNLLLFERFVSGFHAPTEGA